MAKKNNNLGKFIAFTTAIAAVSATCYVFRDQIKESSLYKKTKDILSDLSQKICKKDNLDDDDFYFDDDEDFLSENIFSNDAKKSREYTSITINSTDANDTSENTFDSSFETPSENFSENTSETSPDDSSESILTSPSEEVTEIFPDESIPTISFGTDHATSSTANTFGESAPETSNEEEFPMAYENEGLSDVSEDPDVLEEQDKLDF